MQTLYGGEGYAQAVLVAKRSIVEEKADLVESILAKLRANNQFVQANTATDILSTIESHLKKGLTPSFSKENLNAQTRARCGVYFTEGEEAKREINATIERIQRVDEESVKPFKDDFFR